MSWDMISRWDANTAGHGDNDFRAVETWKVVCIVTAGE